MQIHFSPEMRQGFARLVDAVGDDEHFSTWNFCSLQDLAEGKPMTVGQAVLNVAETFQGAADYTNKTGDEKTAQLVTELLRQLTPSKTRPQPFTLSRVPSKGIAQE